MFNFPRHLFCDVRIETTYRSLIRIEMGRLEEIKEKTDTGAFIRVFDGNRWYYSSTTGIDGIQMEIDALAELAIANKEILDNPVAKKLRGQLWRLYKLCGS